MKKELVMANIVEVKHSEISGGTRETTIYSNGTSKDVSHNGREYTDITYHDYKGNSESWTPSQPLFGGEPVAREKK